MPLARVIADNCSDASAVKTQQHLYQTGARSRTQAVEQARALGLLAPFLSQAPIGGSGA